MKTYKLQDSKIAIAEQDSDGESPDGWGDTSTFLVFEHRQFNIKKDFCSAHDVYTYLNNKEEGDASYDDYYIFSVSAYIHSGISLSLGNRHGFDMSNTGFILIDKTEKDWSYDLQRKSNDDIKEEWSNEEIAKHFAEGLIETWNTYLSGEVYRISVYNQIKCEHCGNIEKEEIDSIGGVYINAKYSIEDAIEENFMLKIVE